MTSIIKVDRCSCGCNKLTDLRFTGDPVCPEEWFRRAEEMKHRVATASDETIERLAGTIAAEATT